MRKKNTREILRAAWDFFVLFSGISTASNLTRTQGRRIHSNGLFLFRPAVEEKPPGPPRPQTGPVTSPDAPAPPSGYALPSQAEPENSELTTARTDKIEDVELAPAIAPVLLRFEWTSEDLLRPDSVKHSQPTAARLSSAGHPQGQPSARPVELRI